MAAGFRPYDQEDSLSPSNLTNSQAPGINMSVVRRTEPHLQYQYFHPQTAILPTVQYSHPYHQYLSQFAPNFVPYYYRLLSRPIMKQEEMDIENYINYEVASQQTIMRQRTLKPLGQLQIQMPPPIKIGQAPVKIPIPVKPVQMRRSSPPKRRIINATLVAMATASGGISNVEARLEPLPPVAESFKQQVAKIQKSQHHYEQLFGRLTTMLKTLNQRYNDADDVPSPPLKRPRCVSTSSAESHLQDAGSEKDNSATFPQRVEKPDGSATYVLGPNGTTISSQQYTDVFWTNAPTATRSLLCMVFTSDELATHTLTGKPSPAFYGRERPPKLQLDPRKVDDIVACVRERTGGKERVIRATITTKCADTAKKYKRRAKKAQKVTIKEVF
ncbi:early boundary activity protein 2 [Drosophila gunungcola]|uniref:early boundary activity protein 2 n=1 Tax=Drosophila gunungcola TaxID=103775 RepID=UPI0022E8AD9E|nr:early boundary activity protein 2 [Drosophila gunungcola]